MRKLLHAQQCQLQCRERSHLVESAYPFRSYIPALPVLNECLLSGPEALHYMPHLPFSSAYPSFAVSAQDSTGFNATNDYDGAFFDSTRGAGFERTAGSTSPQRLSTAKPPSSSNTRQAGRDTSLGSSSPPKTAWSQSRVPRKLQAWSPNSYAFTGSVGHHAVGGERSALARPALADVQHHVTRHPCDATPGPGKYDADPVKPTFTSYEREAAAVGRVRRSAVTGGLAWLGQTSIQSRLAPKVPYFSTPGPGAYNNERSDFDTLWRAVDLRGTAHAHRPDLIAASSTSRQGVGREDHSVRGNTVVFGTASRSAVYPRPGQSEAARFGVHAPRPPAATNYSPLSNQDIVYLSMNKRGTSPPPHFGKVGQMGSPPRVKVFELSTR